MPHFAKTPQRSSLSFKDMATILHNEKKKKAQQEQFPINDPQVTDYTRDIPREPQAAAPQPIEPQQEFPINDPNVTGGNYVKPVQDAIFSLSGIEAPPTPITPATKQSLFGSKPKTRRYDETAEAVGYDPLDQEKIDRNKRINKFLSIGEGLGALYNAAQMGNLNPFYSPKESMTSPFKAEIGDLENDYKNGYKRARDLALAGKLKNIELDNAEAINDFNLGINQKAETDKAKKEAEAIAAKNEFTLDRDTKEYNRRVAVANIKANGKGGKTEVPDYVAALLQDQLNEIDSQINDPENLEDKAELRKRKKNLIKNFDNWDPINNTNHKLIDYQGKQRVETIKNKKYIDNVIDNAQQDGVITDEERGAIANLIAETYKISPQEALQRLNIQLPSGIPNTDNPDNQGEPLANILAEMVTTEAPNKNLDNAKNKLAKMEKFYNEKLRLIGGNLSKEEEKLINSSPTQAIKILNDLVENSSLSRLDKGRMKQIITAKYRN